MDVILTVARFALAAIWVVAAAGKLLDWRSIPPPLTRLGWPGWMIRTGAIGLSVLELVLAGLVLSGSAARVGAIASALLLSGFVGMLAFTTDRGSTGGCGCLGRFERTHLPVASLVRAELLAALAAGIVWLGWDRSFPSLISWLTPRYGWQWVLVAGALGAVMLRKPLAAGWERFNDLAAWRRGLALSAGLPVGTVAPMAYLPSGFEALVFIRDRCTPCDQLLGSLPRPETVAAIRIVSINGGQGELAGAYRVTGVPAAVVIGPDGRIASPLAVGVPAVRALLGSGVS